MPKQSNTRQTTTTLQNTMGFVFYWPSTAGHEGGVPWRIVGDSVGENLAIEDSFLDIDASLSDFPFQCWEGSYPAWTYHSNTVLLCLGGLVTLVSSIYWQLSFSALSRFESLYWFPSTSGGSFLMRLSKTLLFGHSRKLLTVILLLVAAILQQNNSTWFSHRPWPACLVSGSSHGVDLKSTSIDQKLVIPTVFGQPSHRCVKQAGYHCRFVAGFPFCAGSMLSTFQYCENLSVRVQALLGRHSLTSAHRDMLFSAIGPYYQFVESNQYLW